MNTVKHGVSFEEKLIAWLDGADKQEIQEFLKKHHELERTYENWGLADSHSGVKHAKDKYFQFLGSIVFPHDEDMSKAMAEHMKQCYIIGYNAGKVSA